MLGHVGCMSNSRHARNHWLIGGPWWTLPLLWDRPLWDELRWRDVPVSPCRFPTFSTWTTIPPIEMDFFHVRSVSNFNISQCTIVVDIQHTTVLSLAARSVSHVTMKQSIKSAQC